MLKVLTGLLITVGILVASPSVSIAPYDYHEDFTVGTVSSNDTVEVATLKFKNIQHIDLCLVGSASDNLPLSILLRRYEPNWSAMSGTADSTLEYDEMRITIESGSFYKCNNQFYITPGQYRLYLWNESGSATLSNVKVRVKGW